MSRRKKGERTQGAGIPHASHTGLRYRDRTMILALFRLVSLRQLRLKLSRTLLTLLGVGLGIALTTAIDLINHSTLESFRKDVDTVAGKAELSITAGSAGFPEAILDEIEDFPGIQALSPLVQAKGFFTLKGRQSSETLVIFGVDMLREKAARDYKTLDTGGQEVDPLEFLAQPDSIIVTQVFAEEHGLKPGSPIGISTSTGLKKLVIRGVLAPEGPATAFGGSLAIMDIEAARLHFAKEGKLDRIDVVPKKGQNARALGDALQKAVGDGVVVTRPETRAESMENMVASFQAVLSFLGSLALVVGLFMVVNSVGISVAERRGEIGTYRSLGAPRRAILWIFIGEAVAIGFAGAALGLVLGRALAELMLGPVVSSMQSQFVDNFYVKSIVFGPRQILGTLAFGVVASALAALHPAWKATRVEPVEALRQSRLGAEAPEKKGPSWGKRLPKIGSAMLLYLAAASLLGITGSHPALEALHALFAVAGAATVAPAGALILVRVIRRFLARRNRTIPRLGAENLLRAPKRTASNVMTLMVGLLLVIIVATVNSSFRSSILSWFDRTLNADIIVSSSGQVISFQTQPLHEDVGREIAVVPGVDATVETPPRSMRFIHVNYAGEQLGMKAVGEPQTPKDYYSIDVKDRDARTAVRAFFNPGHPRAFVSENFVLHFGKKTGDRIILPSPSGPVELLIEGIVTDFANPRGVIYIPQRTYRQLWKDPLVNVFAVNVKEGFDPDQVRLEIDRRFGEARGIVTTSNAALRRQFESVVDRSFAMTRAVEFAALGVALLGLMNTLLIGVMERMRELGTLRAVGMSRGQMARMIVWESLFTGLLTGLMASVIGGWISYFWMKDSLSTILGWVVDFHFPWGSVSWTLALGLFVGALAALFPARRAAGLEIREALSYE
ncbi:MAG: FtsX-like permease family protein [Bdellovibrionales bacterium]|nr:FtsX-like permease family protein [Bdellovibrionales bacterium]